VKRLRWFGMMLVLGAWCAPVHAQAPATPPYTISLLTFGPGEIYWERFGHNAIVVRDNATGEATSYNYGMFDFGEDDFFVNFARGVMTYQAVASRADEDIAWYAGEGRFVIEQELRLDADQALALKRFLDWNVQPDNARYRYDYYTSNCSTRVRDALDDALGGALRAQLISPSRGYTYRLLTDALMRAQPLLMGVLDAGLGPFADRRLSFWDDSFVPMELMAHLREVTVPGADGAPIALVAAERVLAPARTPVSAEGAPDLRWPFFLAGLAVAGLLYFLCSRHERTPYRRGFAVLAASISFACGVAGAILLALWSLTEHRSAWHNENLLVLSPLCLLLVPAWWRSSRASWQPSRFTRSVAAIIAALAAFALFSKILPWFPQANLPWILLLLPVHLVLAASVLRPR
jgi:hypothetical protein